MNKYVRLVIEYAAAAVVIIVLYSPGLLALRPTDPGVLRPGLAIIFAILIVAFLVWRAWVAVKPDKFEYLEAGKDDSVERITSTLQRFTQNKVLGVAAQSALNELESAQRKQGNLEDMLASKFSVGSLSYDRFDEAIVLATQTVEKNAALLANRMQSFDTAEYRQLATLIESGDYKRDNIPDSIQEEKARVYIGQLKEMDAIIAANESLLLELDKFGAEIAQLDSGGASEANEDMVRELRQLTQEAQYYR